MAFFEQAITVLQTLVIALGAGLGIWGVINLLEGYGQDNPASKSQGIKQLIPMLMYGREAQSKTRIASPATIPKSGERNRKIHSCMLYLISI